jgi:hypothetical protein
MELKEELKKFVKEIAPKLKLYILDENGEPVSERNERKWKRWHRENMERKFVRESFRSGFRFRTMFLGQDMSFGQSEKPVLWETLVFNREVSPRGLERQRYSSREDALIGHDKLVEKYTRGLE